MGILSSLLSGALYGTQLGNMLDGPSAGGDGHLFAAIDVAGFEEPGRFRRRADQIVRQIRESRPAKAGQPLYAPGGLEAAIEASYTRDGIPLNEATLDGLGRAAARAGAALTLG